MFENSKWVIYDGDGTKPSTNGTWLYMETAYEIEDEMVFKAAQTMFQIKMVDAK